MTSLAIAAYMAFPFIVSDFSSEFLFLNLIFQFEVGGRTLGIHLVFHIIHAISQVFAVLTELLNGNNAALVQNLQNHTKLRIVDARIARKLRKQLSHTGNIVSGVTVVTLEPKIYGSNIVTRGQNILTLVKRRALHDLLVAASVCLIDIKFTLRK